MMSAFIMKTAQSPSFHWAEPIIADEISLLYERIKPDLPTEMKKLVGQHLKMWHYVLLKKNREAESLHKSVMKAAADFGISEQGISSINDAVIKLLAALYDSARNPR